MADNIHPERGEQCYVENSGPIHLPSIGGFLAIERIRVSPVYVNSFMPDWRILWIRPENKRFINLHKLQTKLLDCPTVCKIHSFGRHFDVDQQNSVLTTKEDKILPTPFNSFKSVGDYIRHMKLRSLEAEQSIGEKIPRNVQGLKQVMDAVSDNKFKPIHITTSDPDFEDPLLLFDNPLRKINAGNERKWPTIEIGETGCLTAQQSADHNLAIINFSHVGCTAWIVIHPSSSAQLLEKIVDCVFEAGFSKPGFHCLINSRSCSVTLEQLEKWKIKYTLLFQEEGDVVVLFPGVIHGKCNMSFCINSSMNFLPICKHDVEIILKFKRCLCCQVSSAENECHRRWIPQIPKMANTSIFEWMRCALISNPLSSSSEQTINEVISNGCVASTDIESFSDTALSVQSQGKYEEDDNSLKKTEKMPLPRIPNYIETFNYDSPENDTPNEGNITVENTNEQNNSATSDKACFTRTDIDKETHTQSCSSIPSTDFVNFMLDYGKVADLEENCEENAQYIFAKKTKISEIDPEIQTPSTELGRNSGILETLPVPTIQTEVVCQPSNIYPNKEFNFTTIDQNTLDNLGLTNVEEHSGKQVDEQKNHETDANTKQGSDGDEGTSLKCPQCSRHLSNSAHLRRHIYLKHSSEDISVQCPICLRRFANKMSLENHRRSKSGSKNTIRKRNRCRGLTERVGDEKRIRCKLCFQLFVLKSGLNRHLRKVHQIQTKTNGGL